jgi:hypothetical protein
MRGSESRLGFYECLHTGPTSCRPHGRGGIDLHDDAVPQVCTREPYHVSLALWGICGET